LGKKRAQQSGFQKRKREESDAALLIRGLSGKAEEIVSGKNSDSAVIGLLDELVHREGLVQDARDLVVTVGRLLALLLLRSLKKKQRK